jgi:hypothetical protein
MAHRDAPIAHRAAGFRFGDRGAALELARLGADVSSTACLTVSSSSVAAIAGTIRVVALSAKPAAAKSRRVKFMAILPLVIAALQSGTSFSPRRLTQLAAGDDQQSKSGAEAGRNSAAITSAGANVASRTLAQAGCEDDGH